MQSTTKKEACKKIMLAESLGLRLLYCRGCEVVELELGAISIKLSPDKIQRLANLLMKASLKLDQGREALSRSESKNVTTPQLLH